MVYRAQIGAVNPSDIFIPILLATYFSTLAGLIAVSFYQKINLLDKVVLAFWGRLNAVIIGIIWYFSTLDQEAVTRNSSLACNFIFFSVVIAFILMAVFKKVNVYDAFIDGAKDGFKTTVKIIPYLVAILVAIGVFRASGAMEWFISGFTWVFEQAGINTDFTGIIAAILMAYLFFH